jgi:kynurenine formamidase
MSYGAGAMTRPDLSAQEFRELFAAVSNWGRWDNDRGALNHLTPDRIAAAAGLVRSGTTIALGLPLPTRSCIDVPEPADHHMTMLPDDGGGSAGLHFAKDYIGGDYHNDGYSHVDAFCHVAFDGFLFDGAPESSITAEGAKTGTIDLLKDGLVGRGVLVDVPRVRGVRWVEPGEYIVRDDLEAAERSQGVEVGPGDILLVRTGHTRRLDELGPWDTQREKAGLHPSAASFLAERGVAALGSDGNNDTAPSATEGVGFPIHVLALNAMGVHLFDYLELEELARYCEEARRWAFMFATAPLHVTGATGSPVNPTAVF